MRKPKGSRRLILIGEEMVMIGGTINEISSVEKGLHILFAPCGNTGLSHVMGAEKEVSDFRQLYMDNPFLECILN